MIYKYNFFENNRHKAKNIPNIIIANLYDIHDNTPIKKAKAIIVNVLCRHKLIFYLKAFPVSNSKASLYLAIVLSITSSGRR